ncbi:receptor-like serine/threonine-protein kinase SD1-6 [Coffea eugenioides]|uniref:receptor-like serine/threonine-protein kinase SD1-6 n=1 Tax=Coffea eugenioides TaxID=49369 RepID=UPI000F60A8DF|nr:receptor-like serine/threonine-protein kinase SD1-6 [Coffea eugenioides]
MGRSCRQYLAILSCIFAFYFSLFCVSQGKDTLGVNESVLVYHGDLLESSNQRFRLTITHPYSWLWFLVIQYMSMLRSIDVWASDSYQTPASKEPAFLTMNADGRLVVYDTSHSPVIVVNSEQPIMISNTTAILLDNGNLVLRAPGGNTVWQSFDHPSNKWLQGMKLGILQSGTRFLTSSPSYNQPSSTLGVDLNNTREITITQDGVVYWRSGTWDGQKLSFLDISDSFGFNFYYVSTPNETYFTWNSSTDPFALLIFSESGNITVSSGDFTNAQVLAVCDVITYRTTKDQPKGCTNSCGVGDGFKEIMGDLVAWDEVSYNDNALRFCKLRCRRNCSCYAYSNTAYDQDGVAMGCKMAIRRHGKLISSNKQTIFARESFVLEKGLEKFQQLHEKRDDESSVFEFTSIEMATNNFSDENKLGQGGFGPVYKGKLSTGQEIAVKRLKIMSGHGIEQFKNEVTVISKLQHRNLVKLLGYCIHGEDRILVYEYLPNGSLDSFIFDTTKRAVLDWRRRSSIIEGIAQGLLYLHKYSRLKIIHRDLKTSNVLLDNDLNPKISDFGTARIFGDDESRANTLRVVGTYGYMSPEYAMNGIISEKSDVYSFGVMMLEIVWDLWKEGRVSDIADPSFGETIAMHEISRYVQVGLLCGEENAADRPTMSDVISMLNGTLVSLRVPYRPAFSAATGGRNNDNLVRNAEPCSNNTFNYLSSLSGLFPKLQYSEVIAKSTWAAEYLAILYCIFAYYFSLFCVSQARDTLGVNESLVVYYGDFLESSNQRFQLTITHPLSWAWYLTVLYVSMRQTIDAWANDNYLIPARTEPAYVTMNPDGKLVVYDISHNQLIVANSQQPVFISNTTATLLDNGNLVLRAPGGNTVWQSFDYPTNKWLQGMKLGVFGSSTILLTSRPTFGDPASTLGINPNNTKEIVIMQDGVVYWRSGIWNGQNFSFLDISDDFGLNFYYVSDWNETYFTWNSSTDPYALFILAATGQIHVSSGDFTDSQALAVCDMIDGKTWKNQTMGCTNPCGAGDGFKEIMGDLDAWDEIWNNDNALHYCKSICRKNCSCYAYSNTTYDNNGVALGCKIATRKKGNLIFSDKQKLFVRERFVLVKEVSPPTQSPELAPSPPWRKKKSDAWKVKLSIAAAAVFLGALALLYLCCNLQRKIHHHEDTLNNSTHGPGNFQLPDERDHELPLFEFSIITFATDQFSEENKLVQGEFGSVYKGKLPTGQEIAVKRLNILSGHGIDKQFETEVAAMSKLQHRNLVKLLGYSIHGEDRILVYEYLPNGSLDSFIFDATTQGVLDWKRRSHIIEGIAQGLLYLHKYSRLRIIHKDLKTSNVLLDNNLNPKISGFGAAKVFGEDESRASTLNIIGTYGYMSPEYAMNGIISEKSDVYSFGVMILETITGKKVTSVNDTDDRFTLVGHVWDLWKEGRISDIADPSLGETIPMHEISRCVQVGLLCVEENAADRPCMSDVISMLNNQFLVGLLVPNRPAFSASTGCRNNGNFVQNPDCSNNSVTISDLEAR